MAEISSTGDQMLAVLERIAQEGPLTAIQVARLCDINRTVAHRLLATLAKRSYVRQTKEGYSLGPTVARLGRMVETGLKEIAKPFMNRLAHATGETVVLHVIDRTDAIVVEQSVGTQHVVKVDHTPGSKHPLSRGASGWSILAFQNERLIQRALKASPMPPTAHGTAEERLAKVRAEGFALSHDELQLGVHGLAMPIFNPDGTCEASLGLLVPSSRSETLFGHHAKLAETVRQISEQLATI